MLVLAIADIHKQSQSCYLLQATTVVKLHSPQTLSARIKLCTAEDQSMEIFSQFGACLSLNKASISVVLC